jgi:hypothetical protein
MKFVSRHLVCLSVVLSLFNIFQSRIVFAADNLPPEQVQVGEAPVASVSTEARTYNLTIQFKNGTTYELLDAPYSDINFSEFQKLDSETQKKFLARRELYLSKVASLLHYTKLIYGTGSMTAHKISQVASPMIDVVKSQFAVFYDKAQNMLMVPFAKIKNWAHEKSSESPVVAITKSGLSQARKLFAHANQRLKKLNAWVNDKIYGEQISSTPVAPPILELALAIEKAETKTPAADHSVLTANSESAPAPNSASASHQNSKSAPAATTISSINDNPEQNLSFFQRIQYRGQKIVYSLLSKLDQTLWEHSRLVVSHNEAVVFLSVSLAGFHGVGTQVSGGMPHTLGIKLGINWATKTLAFEIYHETESLARAVTPSTGYGFIPKAGVAILSQVAGEEMSVREGYYIYPPSPPGLPLAPGFTAMLKDQFSIGYTTSTATLPFSFVSDLFWYDTVAKQKPVLRVTFSPKVLGFFRVHFLSRKSNASSVQMIAEALDERDQKQKSKCSDLLK